MSKYSLTKYLIENNEREIVNYAQENPVSHLVSGIRKIKNIVNENNIVPITPKGTGWDQLESPNRLRRIFKIENYESRLFFIREVLMLAEQEMHYISLSTVYENVTIEIFTEGINDITNIDFEYANDIDEIYIDALFSFSNLALGDESEIR